MNPFENYNPYAAPRNRLYNVLGEPISSIFKDEDSVKQIKTIVEQTATPGGMSGVEIEFISGTEGYPGAGQQTFTLLDENTGLPLLQNMIVHLYRQGNFQPRDNTVTGYVHDAATGTITVYPAISSTPERFNIVAFQPGSWKIIRGGNPAQCSIFSPVFSPVFGTPC